MALEAVVLPQSLFEYTVKEWRAAGEGERHELGGIIEDENGDPDCSSVQQSLSWNANSLPHKAGEDAVEVVTRKKRRRSRCIADKEKVESQRMTHIAVERNRRRQMNEYLAVLRSLMPSSYVQKGDQASIVAGAVYYVRELEQLLQTLQAQRRLQQQPDMASAAAAAATASFADFFTFPQFSPYPYNGRGSNSDTNSDMTANQTLADIASIEVTLAEGHAHLKLLSAPEAAAQAGDGAAELATGAAASQRDLRPRDGHVLLQSQVRLSSCLPTRVCLCSSAAVSSEFASADELATTVNQMLGRMEEEEKFGFPRFECKQTNKKSGS